MVRNDNKTLYNYFIRLFIRNFILIFILDGPPNTIRKHTEVTTIKLVIKHSSKYFMLIIDVNL